MGWRAAEAGGTPEVPEHVTSTSMCSRCGETGDAFTACPQFSELL